MEGNLPVRLGGVSHTRLLGLLLHTLHFVNIIFFKLVVLVGFQETRLCHFFAK
jgi:hypothetical protein